ncbi:hypothetical protein JG687_00013251 [Phytophthora cactorum]|uniref:Uncharacterized protein n=1 Tax=Phytophthora cactorum TaxID=29920 RepID=A0A329RVT5_9STRA|nr:hypothetical protein PC111_g18426 [Phytophthora cactorum]KAG2896430.1 hypothetical protein PC114_g15070 [Phytophthora cactorum]KAG2905700.1 hypothetical protein PC117_g20691 [Phytophthora cactorum]KAG2984438.1 hypothetical protein PC119_g20411 [Phytophthora cactorum]KAG3056920.1 hypothetical protein PC121_g15092 [Phytophthora cactorum]
MKKTGDNPSSIKEADVHLWAILNDAFLSKEGLCGDVLVDTNDDEEERCTDDDGSVTVVSASKGKIPPVAQLAHAMENCMTVWCWKSHVNSSY